MAGEVYMLSISVVLSTAVLYLPFLIASVALQDSWLAVILGTAVAIPFTLFSLALVTRFPEKGLEEIVEELFGKYLGRLLAVVYALFFLYSSALIIRQVEEFIVLTLMPETPPLAIRILFVLILFMGVYEGTLAIVRTNVYVMPVGAFVIVAVIGLATTKMSFDNLTPAFTVGLEGILNGGFFTTAWLLQIPMVILIFFKFIEIAKLKPIVKKESVFVVIITGGALFLGALGTIASFGPRLTADIPYPSFAMARIISIGGFLEHIEVTFVGVWIAAMFMAGTAYCFMSILMITWVIGFKDTKKISFPIAATLLYLPAAIANDLSSVIHQLRVFFPTLCVIFGGVLPFAFFALAVIMNKGISPKELSEMQKEQEKKNPKDNFGAQDGDIAEDPQNGDDGQNQEDGNNTEENDEQSQSDNDKDDKDGGSKK